MHEDHDNFREKRKSARMDLKFRVVYSLMRDGSDKQQYEAQGSNISAGGLLLITESPIESGTKLKIKIFLDKEDNGPISITGIVVHSKQVKDKIAHNGVSFPGQGLINTKKFMDFCFEKMYENINLSSEDKKNK